MPPGLPKASALARVAHTHANSPQMFPAPPIINTFLTYRQLVGYVYSAYIPKITTRYKRHIPPNILSILITRFRESVGRKREGEGGREEGRRGKIARLSAPAGTTIRFASKTQTRGHLWPSSPSLPPTFPPSVTPALPPSLPPSPFLACAHPRELEA